MEEIENPRIGQTVYVEWQQYRWHRDPEKRTKTVAATGRITDKRPDGALMFRRLYGKRSIRLPEDARIYPG